MDIVDRNFLIKHGFSEDIDKKVLYELFANNSKLKSINISVHSAEPFMLLARNEENNVKAELNSVRERRLILKKNKTVIMNILLNEIDNCLIKNYGDELYDFEFELRGIRYSLNVTI